MKLKTFLVIFPISGITAIVLLLAPSVGLGEKYDFVLYRSLGLSRSSAMWWLLWLTVFFVLIANLRIIRSHLEHVSWHELWPRLTNVVQKPAGFWLFLNEREH